MHCPIPFDISNHIQQVLHLHLPAEDLLSARALLDISDLNLDGSQLDLYHLLRLECHYLLGNRLVLSFQAFKGELLLQLLLQAGHLPLGLPHLLPDGVINLSVVALIRCEHPLVHNLDLVEAQLHIVH